MNNPRPELEAEARILRVKEFVERLPMRLEGRGENVVIAILGLLDRETATAHACGRAEGLDMKNALEMLLASCERLQADMGGTPGTTDCTGLLTTWDPREPTIYYLERNMQWAREALAKVDEPRGGNG